MNNAVDTATLPAIANDQRIIIDSPFVPDSKFEVYLDRYAGGARVVFANPFDSDTDEGEAFGELFDLDDAHDAEDVNLRLYLATKLEDVNDMTEALRVVSGVVVYGRFPLVLTIIGGAS